MLTYEEVVEQLKLLNERKWVKTHRAGPTGIGKTLEDLTGIPENNIPTPDMKGAELKSTRKTAKSMLTLFTKSPLPDGANSVLLKRFGYQARGNEKPDLHTTVSTLKFNTLRGKQGFIVEVSEDKVELVSGGPAPMDIMKYLTDKPEEKKEVLGYWNRRILRECFEKKFPQLLFVKAECRGSGKNEEFWFNEAWLLSEFSFDNFINLLKSGDILVDIRIGQYPNGRSHDHGTGFRVQINKLDMCFQKRKNII
ncbi:MAG: MvaI/BcnI family restriction endonuclease [Candidatus Aenigmarchaeota archaeon]|nr:MvaI/BcnI family restriction endonuclease [Candidatus Aenigmarchaeota archaeon]